MGASFGILKIAGIVRCSEVTTATIVDVVEKNKSSKKSTSKYNPDKPAEFLLNSSANYAGLAGAAAVIIAGVVVVVLGLGIARRSEGVPVFRA